MKEKLIICFFVLSIVSCTTSQTFMADLKREPAAKKLSMTCNEIVHGFFHVTPKVPEALATVKNDIKILKKWREEYTFDYTYSPELEVDDGAILAPNMFVNDDPIFNKDSLKRNWTKFYNKEKGLFFRRYLDEAKSQYVEYEAQPLKILTRKILIELNDGHRLTIVVPSTKEEIENAFTEQIIKLIGILPKAHLSKLEYISVSPGKFLHERAPGTATSKEITFYNSSLYLMLENYSINEELIRHEFGHILAHEVYGSAKPNADWIEAIRLDRASVSAYGDTKIQEDFAEAVELYLKLEAENNLGDKKWLKFKYRFAELDRIFHNDPQLHYKIARIISMKKTFPIRILTLAGVSGAGGATYYYWDISGSR